MLDARADVLVLDEPDNFLDIPAKESLESALADSDKCVLMVSHDRRLLAVVPDKLLTIEGGRSWVHPGNYSTYEEARERRQEDLADDLRRWNDEERRLFHHYKEMKKRAALNAKNAPKADAAETRWRKFADAGPPQPPVRARQIRTRLRGAASGERVLRCSATTVGELIKEFALELYAGDRVALVGPNGSGKSHLLRAFAGIDPAPGIELGARVRAGYFTQGGEPDLDRNRPLRDVLRNVAATEEIARSALGRYGLANAYEQSFESLSGGEKARVEILILEMEGANLLLLDEPTDNLDIPSAEALEAALDTFTGTVVSVSHDRTYLSHATRFLLLTRSGLLYEVTSYDETLKLLRSREARPEPRQARSLMTAGVAPQRPGEPH